MATFSRRMILERTLVRGLYGLAIGFVFAAFEGNGAWQWWLIYPLIGGLTGVGTRLLDYLLIYTRLRRRSFWFVWLVRSLTYMVLIVLIILVVLSLYSWLDHDRTWRDWLGMQSLIDWLMGEGAAKNLFYSFLILVGIQFIVLMLRLIGPGIMLNYMIGRYSQPIEEERIFMFVDLRSSTTIAEELGAYKWHEFLNDYFFDIGRPVQRAKGEIYQYVGDEFVVSWPLETGLKRLRCIRCFFWIWDLMEKRRQYYLDSYGSEPIFKAGYHVGKVVTGEIGDFKREIVFHGDVVNTASRIQEQCNLRNRRLLLSGNLLEKLDIKDQFTAEYIDQMLLRGKNEEIELYSLDPIQT